MLESARISVYAWMENVNAQEDIAVNTVKSNVSKYCLLNLMLAGKSSSLPWGIIIWIIILLIIIGVIIFIIVTKKRPPSSVPPTPKEDAVSLQSSSNHWFFILNVLKYKLSV